MSGGTAEPRVAVMILVEATWEDQSGTVHSSPARMENRSTHGACIRIRTRIGVGWRLSIQSHREQFSGVARYCRPDGKEFLVGIMKDEAYRPVVEPAPAEGVPERKVVRAEGRRTLKERSPNRVERRAGNVSSGNVARIETPIAERLMVKEPSPPPTPAASEPG